MCFQVKCGTCGKSTWAGCGRHVASVHAQVPDGHHCVCRDWPGVAVLPTVEEKAGHAAATATSGTAKASASSTEAADAAQ